MITYNYNKDNSIVKPLVGSTDPDITPLMSFNKLHCAPELQLVLQHLLLKLDWQR